MTNATANRPPLGLATLPNLSPQLKSGHPETLNTLKTAWDQLVELWRAYDKLLTYSLAIVALLSFGYVLAAATLSVLSWIPFAAPALKLIGFGYASWFGIRHLLFAVNREVLGNQAQQLRVQILG
jgi:hypothetical protein